METQLITRATDTKPAQPKKKNKRKLFFLCLGLTATGILSHFGYKYWKKNKKSASKPENNAPSFKAEIPKSSATTTKSAPKTKQTTTKKTTTKGSAKTTTKTSTKSATANTASSSTKTTETNSGSEKINGIDPSLIAKGIYASIIAKDFKKAMFFLKLLKTPQQYSAVSKAFIKFRLAGVHQTLVNGMLSSFKLSDQKDAIRAAFKLIGLKYDGKKWTLSGFGSGFGKTETKHPMLITNRQTQVWKNPKSSVNVPLNMVLGKEITRRGDFTLFENQKQLFLVQSAHVNHYNR